MANGCFNIKRFTENKKQVMHVVKRRTGVCQLPVNRRQGNTLRKRHHSLKHTGCARRNIVVALLHRSMGTSEAWRHGCNCCTALRVPLLHGAMGATAESYHGCHCCTVLWRQLLYGAVGATTAQDHGFHCCTAPCVKMLHSTMGATAAWCHRCHCCMSP